PEVVMGSESRFVFRWMDYRRPPAGRQSRCDDRRRNRAGLPPGATNRRRAGLGRGNAGCPTRAIAALAPRPRGFPMDIKQDPNAIPNFNSGGRLGEPQRGEPEQRQSSVELDPTAGGDAAT